MSHVQRHNGDLASPQPDFAGVRPFKLTESVVEDGCWKIEIEGELDLAVADRLGEALANCRGDLILISLKACQFIDSSGIALILHADRENDSRIVLHSPCAEVLRVLEVTGLTSNDFVFADREQALSTLFGLPADSGKS